MRDELPIATVITNSFIDDSCKSIVRTECPSVMYSQVLKNSMN